MTEFDVVLFGATGFTGRLTARQLARTAGPEVSIALAGRSHERLTRVRAELGPRAAEWPLVIVDAQDAASVRALAGRARVIATTVGPFARDGLPLVEACAVAGTHYCDITGEVLFVRESADTWHTTAQETGARIVHACGFDSIPADLGVLVTADQAAAEGAGELTTTTLSVQVLRGGVSGGTIDTLRTQASSAVDDAAARAILADPYALSPDRAAEPSTPGRAFASGLQALPIRRDPHSGRWTAPYIMAPFDTRIVRRSNALQNWRYGRQFHYREVSDFGSSVTSPWQAMGASAGVAAVVGGLAFAPTRTLLDRVLPKPGDGPDELARSRGAFRLVIDAETTSSAAYRTVVAADRDPGYGATSVMLSQSALSLAFDDERLPAVAGVLTPATAMGQALVDRLRDQDMTFDCQRVSGAVGDRQARSTTAAHGGS